MALDLQGKRVVVTGGSSGIGEAIVRQAAQAGAFVAFTYNSKAEEAKKIAEETGTFYYGPFSLGNLDSVKGFVGTMNSTTPNQIDYFIANAGVELSGDLGKHTFEEINRVVTANLIGNMCLLREAITSGLMRQGGQISVVGSIAADGNHDQFAYSASKAGLRGAVECLWRYDASVKNQGLGVKLLEPAFVRTGMAERTLTILERRVIPKIGGEALVQQFRDSKSVMEPDYAAQQILELTADSRVLGIRAIPEGAKLHEIRETYLNQPKKV